MMVQNSTMQRSSTLRKGCLEAVDEAIAGCSVDEFVAGFSGLPEAQRGALAKVLQSVQAELRGNMQTELDEMLGESGVDAGLGPKRAVWAPATRRAASGVPRAARGPLTTRRRRPFTASPALGARPSDQGGQRRAPQGPRPRRK